MLSCYHILVASSSLTVPVHLTIRESYPERGLPFALSRHPYSSSSVLDWTRTLRSRKRRDALAPRAESRRGENLILPSPLSPSAASPVFVLSNGEARRWWSTAGEGGRPHAENLRAEATHGQQRKASLRGTPFAANLRRVAARVERSGRHTQRAEGSLHSQTEGGDELGSATPAPCISSPHPRRDSNRGGAAHYEA
uniref:Uncharacterized protein n=1 Tax=Setaria viridis TaxID=4556 RepID=A0A4U6TCQ5_SETVI|nr:hypothetical protein SEVIR_8G072600v2 [Setaria viridis]